MRAVTPIHAGAWAFWLGAVIAALAVSRNPIYVGLVLAWIAVTWHVAKHVACIMNPQQAVPLSPLRFGLFVVTVSAIFNALMTQSGDHALFRLPIRIPLAGGAFTLEAMAYGALNGLVLTGLYAAFLLVNRVLPVRDMVRLVPRAYHSVAIVVSIAVTFVPATLRQVQQIREAQAVRGHRIRGLRSWLPLLLPLLTGGMERALQLAESMTARGYAASSRSQHEAWTQGGLVSGLLLFTGGLLLRLAWGRLSLGLALAIAGVALAVVSIWLAGRSHPHTVYRPTPWRLTDWLTAAGALFATLMFAAPVPGLDRSSLFYYPYPSLSAPDFSIWIGVGTWGLLMPAMILMAMSMHTAPERELQNAESESI